MTLPDILGADRSLAQSSAYRSLAVLVDAGVVRRLVHGGDHAHYELAEHLTEHHHHLVCDACGIGRRRHAADAGRDRDGPLVRRRRRPARVRRLAPCGRHLRPVRRLRDSAARIGRSMALSRRPRDGRGTGRRGRAGAAARWPPPNRSPSPLALVDDWAPTSARCGAAAGAPAPSRTRPRSTMSRSAWRCTCPSRKRRASTPSALLLLWIARRRAGGCPSGRRSRRGSTPATVGPSPGSAREPAEPASPLRARRPTTRLGRRHRRSSRSERATPTAATSTARATSGWRG